MLYLLKYECIQSILVKTTGPGHYNIEGGPPSGGWEFLAIASGIANASITSAFNSSGIGRQTGCQARPSVVYLPFTQLFGEYLGERGQ